MIAAPRSIRPEGRPEGRQLSAFVIWCFDQRAAQVRYDKSSRDACCVRAASMQLRRQRWWKWPGATPVHRPGCAILAGSVARWSSLVARWAHNPKVAGSNPALATTDHSIRATSQSQANAGRWVGVLLSAKAVPTRCSVSWPGSFSRSDALHGVLVAAGANILRLLGLIDAIAPFALLAVGTACGMHRLRVANSCACRWTTGSAAHGAWLAGLADLCATARLDLAGPTT